MKKLIYPIMLNGILFLCMNSLSLSEQPILSLKVFKTVDGALAEDFLFTLKKLFNREIFIETGTYAGGTTARAASIFKEVHSVELSTSMYQAACHRFSSNNRVHLYCGNSGTILTKILSAISEKPIIWLDAHYCGVGTGRGSSDSPIIQELEAIKAKNITEAVILIDDLRGFCTENWPSFPEVINQLLSINSEYKIVTFGDAIVAYPKNLDIIMSPCLESCTVSRLFDTGCFDYDIDKVLRAEEIISNTTGLELEALYKLFSFIHDSDDQYGILWQGLILERTGHYAQASCLFKKIIDATHSRRINHWRVMWYLARSAFESGNKDLAKSAIQKVIAENPHFTPAQDLLIVL